MIQVRQAGPLDLYCNANSLSAGYGLTLSGDKPCRVQTVRAGGASDKAGVREGDVIIKVNGQQVTESLHSEVVKLIQLGQTSHTQDEDDIT